MAKNGLAILFVFGLAASATADDGPTVPTSLASSGGFIQPSKGDHRAGVGLGVETWRAEMGITDSSKTGGPPFDPEQGIEFFAQHNLALLIGEYSYHGLKSLVIRGRVGIGFESLSTTIDADASAFGGERVDDTRYENELVWEIGASAAYSFDKFDAGLSITFRGGQGEADRPSPETIEYSYTFLRIGGEFGYRASETLRPFIGLRYTLYDGEWDFNDPSGFISSATYDLELNQPFGITLGLDLESGAIAARLEILLVDIDAAGFGASVLYKF